MEKVKKHVINPVESREASLMKPETLAMAVDAPDSVAILDGFGSLDDESLDQAMRALSGLADGNRLVGIISHVGELKSRIDKQIVVTKEKSGGSKASIIM